MNDFNGTSRFFAGSAGTAANWMPLPTKRPIELVLGGTAGHGSTYHYLFELPTSNLEVGQVVKVYKMTAGYTAFRQHTNGNFLLYDGTTQSSAANMVLKVDTHRCEFELRLLQHSNGNYYWACTEGTLVNANTL